MNIDIKQIKSGLDSLANAVDELATAPAPTPTILDRELSGNKINGGMITNFQSVGITDEAKSTAGVRGPTENVCVLCVTLIIWRKRNDMIIILIEE